jgi:hypothetical protein
MQREKSREERARLAKELAASGRRSGTDFDIDIRVCERAMRTECLISVPLPHCRLYRLLLIRNGRVRRWSRTWLATLSGKRAATTCPKQMSLLSNGAHTAWLS